MAINAPNGRYQKNGSAPAGWQEHRVPGGGGALLVPPGYGGFPIPHAGTFSTRVNLQAKTWYNPDEAYRNNRTQQQAMRRDPVIMEPLRQRQLATALLEWSIHPEDGADPIQREVCDTLTRWFRRIPNFLKLRLCLLEAIWYGKYAVAIDYDWSSDFTSLELCRWRPLHGDKLRFEQETSRLGSFRRIDSRVRDNTPIDWRYTEEAPAEIFDATDRKAIALHQHELEDGDYWDWCYAGAVDGIGLRTRVYWPWYYKQQGLQWLMDFLQRSGTGVKIWYFEKGNDADYQSVKKIAETYSNETVILAPHPIGEEKPSPILDFKEPGMGGAGLIRDILQDYFGGQIKRMICGQTLTSEAGSTGLGGNVAEKHEKTFLNLVQFDSVNLAETITREILWVVCDYNYPGMDWRPRFNIAFQQQDPKDLLEAAKIFQEMGGDVGENQVRDIIGLRAPEESDRILERVTQDVPWMGGGFGDPPPGSIFGQQAKPNGGDEGKQDKEESGDPIRYAALHAPKGGVTIHGTKYAGGEFIPGDVAENLSDEEKAQVEKGEDVGASGGKGKAEAKKPKAKPDKPVAAKPAKAKPQAKAPKETAHEMRLRTGEVVPMEKYDLGPAMDKEGNPTLDDAGNPIHNFKWDMPGGHDRPEWAKEIAIAPAWSGVVLSSSPDANNLVWGFDEKGRSVKTQNPRFAESQSAQKFSRIRQLAKDEDEIMAGVESDLKTATGKRRDSAALIYLIHSMGLRPGSETDTGAEKQAYGATTLRGEHFVDDPKTGPRLEFVGKKGVDLNLSITNPNLIDVLRQQKKAKGDGKLFETNDNKLRDYLATKHENHYKVKDLRTLKGTSTAWEHANAMPVPSNDLEYRKAIDLIADKVSTVLGNTPDVALTSYIDPQVFSSWSAAKAIEGPKDEWKIYKDEVRAKNKAKNEAKSAAKLAAKVK